MNITEFKNSQELVETGNIRTGIDKLMMNYDGITIGGCWSTEYFEL